MRICSLLPSATEIVFALDKGHELVAVTHECDYPPPANQIPVVTSSIVDSHQLDSVGIDAAIRLALHNLSTIYQLDREKLSSLAPDLILTQELCDVCAVSYERVLDAVQEVCPGSLVESLEPTSLEGILETIRQVGTLIQAEARANQVLQGLDLRLEHIRSRAAGEPRPNVLAVEWLDPLFVGGHWVPEMIEIAGGTDAFGVAGARSYQMDWSEVNSRPIDVIVLMPCGFDMPRTITEFGSMALPVAWNTIQAVRDGRVFAVDGSAYFNRPGPRIVEGVEILAEILHPGLFGAPRTDRAVAVQRN